MSKICPHCKSYNVVGISTADSDISAIYSPFWTRRCYRGCGKVCAECPQCKLLTINDICESCGFDFGKISDEEWKKMIEELKE